MELFIAPLLGLVILLVLHGELVKRFPSLRPLTSIALFPLTFLKAMFYDSPKEARGVWFTAELWAWITVGLIALFALGSAVLAVVPLILLAYGLRRFRKKFISKKGLHDLPRRR